MTIGWLRFLVVFCMLLGMLLINQLDVETIYSGPFIISIVVVFGGFLELHRRSLQRIDALEALLAAQSRGVAQLDDAAGEASPRS